MLHRPVPQTDVSAMKGLPICKPISTRNQKSNFKKFCSQVVLENPLFVQVVKNILHPLRGPVPRVPQLQGSPAMHLPEAALLIPPRRANGITTWSKMWPPQKKHASGYIQTPAWCFLCILVLFGWEFNSSISPETLHKSNGGRLGIRNQLKFEFSPTLSPIPAAGLTGGQHQHWKHFQDFHDLSHFERYCGYHNKSKRTKCANRFRRTSKY